MGNMQNGQLTPKPTETAKSGSEGASGNDTGTDKNAKDQAQKAAKGATDNAATETGGGASDTTGQIDLYAYLLGLLDENNDGKLSPGELKKGLAKFDKNNDGKISKSELMAAGATEAQAQQLIDSMDTNGDGQISLGGSNSEVDAFITKANTNNDNEISQNELDAVLSTKDSIMTESFMSTPKMAA
jgi:Ca2+-binding EF-hand superfamily protein